MAVHQEVIEQWMHHMLAELFRAAQGHAGPEYPISISDLRSRLGIDPQVQTKVLAGAAERGWVSVEAMHRDVVWLTDEGGDVAWARACAAGGWRGQRE